MFQNLNWHFRSMNAFQVIWKKTPIEIPKLNSRAWQEFIPSCLFFRMPVYWNKLCIVKDCCIHLCWDKNCHCTFLLITGIINILFGYICLSLGLYVGIDPFSLSFLRPLVREDIFQEDCNGCPIGLHQIFSRILVLCAFEFQILGVRFLLPWIKSLLYGPTMSW